MTEASFPFSVSMSVGNILVQVTFRQLWWIDFMDVASLASLGDTTSQMFSYKTNVTKSLTFCVFDVKGWKE